MLKLKHLQKKYLHERAAQSLVEYSVVLGIVALVLMTMRVTFQRGLQGMIKTVADQIGVQNNAEQLVTTETGRMMYSNTNSQSAFEKNERDFMGERSFTYNDRTDAKTESLTNLGLVEY